MKKTNCAKSLYIYDRRMYIDRDLWNLYILRRSLRLFESSFSAYLTFSALSHLEILRPHTVADLNINLLAASLSNKVDFPLIELADINIISTAKKLDANDVFIYSAIIHIQPLNEVGLYTYRKMLLENELHNASDVDFTEQNVTVARSLTARIPFPFPLTEAESELFDGSKLTDELSLTYTPFSKALAATYRAMKDIYL